MIAPRHTTLERLERHGFDIHKVQLQKLDLDHIADLLDQLEQNISNSYTDEQLMDGPGSFRHQIQQTLNETKAT